MTISHSGAVSLEVPTDELIVSHHLLSLSMHLSGHQIDLRESQEECTSIITSEVPCETSVQAGGQEMMMRSCQIHLFHIISMFHISAVHVTHCLLYTSDAADE